MRIPCMVLGASEDRPEVEAFDAAFASAIGRFQASGATAAARR